MKRRSGIKTSEMEENMTSLVLDVKSSDNKNNTIRMKRQRLHDI